MEASETLWSGQGEWTRDVKSRPAASGTRGGKPVYDTGVSR